MGEANLKIRIVNETTKMFAIQGVKAVRMDDIAEHMGISKRTIYEIFGDKENLIMECLNCFRCHIEERADEITASANNLMEKYLLFFSSWEKQADANYNILGDVKKFYPKIYEKYTDGHAKNAYTKLRESLEEGVAEGYFLESVNLDLAISVFGHSIYGIIKKDATLPHNVSERDAFRYILTYFIRGIATLKGIKMIDEYFEKNKNS